MAGMPTIYRQMGIKESPMQNHIPLRLEGGATLSEILIKEAPIKSITSDLHYVTMRVCAGLFWLNRRFLKLMITSCFLRAKFR